MDSALNARINAMLRRDIIVGVTFVTVMWVVLIFVFVTTAASVPDDTVTVVMGIAALLLGVFNTLGMATMIRRYRAEREHIYTEDLEHLDASREASDNASEVSVR